MEKNSTLFTPASDSVSVEVRLNEKKSKGQLYPKADTIRHLCQFARAAFTDASLCGIPAIVLN